MIYPIYYTAYLYCIWPCMRAYLYCIWPCLTSKGRLRFFMCSRLRLVAAASSVTWHQWSALPARNTMFRAGKVQTIVTAATATRTRFWYGPKPPSWASILSNSMAIIGDLKRKQRLCTTSPANTTHRNNVGFILTHRLRRWSNMKPTLFQCVMFAESQVVHLCIL